MAGNPGVSVIVPVYKTEQYIKFCVDSILAQTFQDFEIILVDDASPDGSVELCRKLYGENEKIKLVRHEKNLGLGAARNTGMKHAVGKYVYFVDSDDFILPDALEKFFNVAEKNNAEVVHTAGWYTLYRDEAISVRQENLKPQTEYYTQEGFLPEDLFYRLNEHWKIYNTCSMVWLCFCRRDFLQKNGIEFLPIIAEDEVFHFALLCCARRYYVLPALFYVYRRRTDSLTLMRNAEHFAKCISSVVQGAVCIKSFLDRIPRFEYYGQWCTEIMDAYFGRFMDIYTLSYYEDLTLSPELDAAANDAFEKFFGDHTPFVKNFFHGHHMFLCQAQMLEQQVQLLQQENQRLKDTLAMFADKQNKFAESVEDADKRIFLLGTPTHGTLEEQATALGELRILQDYFPEYEIVEIPCDYPVSELDLARYIRRDDLIFMHGGNMNVKEQLRRALIQNFPDNKIIIFPQSIYFADDAGLRELARSQQIYNSHKDLHLMTCDEGSFEVAQKFFPQVNNYLLPDAAIALHGVSDDVDVEREGVLFDLRGDAENLRDDVQILQRAFAEANIPFEVVDTAIAEQVTADTREEKLRAVLLKIRQSKLVVTDKFCGVIFAFVTRTPVLAFDMKISSGIKWFENFPSVFRAEAGDWNGIENFINAVFDDADIFEELHSDVKIDIENLFFDALNQIVDANTLQMSQAAKKFQ